MALQREIIKSVAVLGLAMMQALGAPLLPAASTTALFVIQAFSLMQVLISSPGKDKSKEYSTPEEATKSVSTWQADTLCRCGLSLVLALMLAQALRWLSLTSSLQQVLSLACLGGCLSHLAVALTRRASQSTVASQEHENPAFWPRLSVAASETESQEKLLSGLVEEFVGPRSMLSNAIFLEEQD